MFDEEKAAARAAAEKEEDISDTSAEMFNEEKAAAKAVEGSTKMMKFTRFLHQCLVKRKHWKKSQHLM